MPPSFLLQCHLFSSYMAYGGMVQQTLLRAFMAIPGTSPLCTPPHSHPQPQPVKFNHGIKAHKPGSPSHCASESGKTYMARLQSDSMVPKNKHSCHQFSCLSIVFISYLIATWLVIFKSSSGAGEVAQ